MAVAASSGVLALILSLLVWRVVGLLSTVAHEGGHAMMMSVSGSRVAGMRVFADGSGATAAAGSLGFVGKVLTGLAGYLGPSGFGLLGALLLSRGRPDIVLWSSLVLLAVALLNMRNPVGIVAVIGFGALVAAVLRYASTGQQEFFAYTWIWLLLYGGFLGVLELQRARGGGPDRDSDAYKLRATTFLPASLWSGIFWLGTLAALVYGAGILLGLVEVGR